MDENGNTIEYESIFVRLFPDHDAGATIESDKRCPKDYTFDEKHWKFAIQTPVPVTDEESMELYNCNLDYFVRAGLRQIIYGETSATKHIKDTAALDDGDDPDNWIEKIAELMESAVRYDPDKERTKSTQKATAASAKKAEAKHGKSIDEIIAEYEAMKAELGS